MKLNLPTLKQVLEIAADKGETGFGEQDILPLFNNQEYDLVFHLDYLTDKGFIIGEFTPGGFAAFAIFPEPIHFVRGEITERGKEYLYLAGLKEKEEAIAKSK